MLEFCNKIKSMCNAIETDIAHLVSCSMQIQSIGT